MFSKPTEPRSIASQLVLRFTPAAAFLLFCALGVLYWIVVRHAFEEDNDVLTDKILALSADMTKSDGPQILDRELKNVRPGERVAYWVRLADPAGRLLGETPGMSDPLPPRVFPPARSSSDWKSKDYRRDGQLYSLVAVTEEVGGQPYTLQVAQDRSSDERFMKEFGALLVVVLAFSIVASAVIARRVAKDGLQSLAAMTQSLKRIGPQRLHERIPPGWWPRELQPLATAFDEMLARLEDSFTRLSQFSADLAHELRTPIANILGEAQVSLTRDRSPDEYREVIESTVAECERLSRIVDSLLFLARAEAGDRQIHRTL